MLSNFIISFTIDKASGIIWGGGNDRIWLVDTMMGMLITMRHKRNIGKQVLCKTNKKYFDSCFEISLVGTDTQSMKKGKNVDLTTFCWYWTLIS